VRSGGKAVAERLRHRAPSRRLAKSPPISLPEGFCSSFFPDTEPSYTVGVSGFES
jgi:hypothetical protein